MSRLDSVGIAKQTAKGTANATMAYFPPVESADSPQQREGIEIEETLGHRFPSRMEYGTSYWESSWSGAARVASFPRILSAFLGLPTSSQPAVGTDPTAYDHLFDPAAAGKVPEWHSLLVNRTDPTTAITDLLYDARGNELTMTVEPNGFLRFESGFVALQLDDTQAEPTVTRDSTPRFTFDEVTVYLDVEGAGEAAIDCGSWSMTYSNNLVTDVAVLGSRTLYDLPYGNASCEVKFMPRSGLSDHYRRALLDDPAAVKVRMLAQGALIGSAVRFGIEHTIYLCEYIDAPAGISAGDNLTGLEVTARAAYSEADSKFIDLTVTNEVASYAT